MRLIILISLLAATTVQSWSNDDKFSGGSSSWYNVQANKQAEAVRPTDSNIIWKMISRELEAKHNQLIVQKSTQTTSFNDFNRKFFQVVGPMHSHQNIVYSPLSLQTLLALLCTGAKGNTAAQLQEALALPVQSKIGPQFRALLETLKTENTAELIMANRIYYADGLHFADSKRAAVRQNFGATFEPVQFAQSQSVSQHINAWIANKTQHRIEHLMSPADLNANTQAILVNAIYFKAKWENEFSSRDTMKADFKVSAGQTVRVDMMFNDDEFRFGEIKELAAQVLEMPYANSKLSMMFILPNSVEGLLELEKRLQNYDLKKLDEKMGIESVQIRIPKFKIEFDLDMIEPLQKLGITELFKDTAELPLFFPHDKVSVSKVQHKAFIDVNEAGSEAAAATFVKLQPLSLPARQVYFKADHPFIFVIRSPDVVYFIGHVVNPATAH